MSIYATAVYNVCARTQYSDFKRDQHAAAAVSVHNRVMTL
jgi:hypothetical protein